MKEVSLVMRHVFSFFYQLELHIVDCPTSLFARMGSIHFLSRSSFMTLWQLLHKRLSDQPAQIIKGHPDSSQASSLALFMFSFDRFSPENQQVGPWSR